jgi:hypothetical protein
MGDQAADASPLIRCWQADPARQARASVVVLSDVGAEVFRRTGGTGVRGALAGWAAAHPLDPASISFTDQLLGDEYCCGHRHLSPILVSESCPQPGRLEVRLRVPVGLAVFEGHFPDIPIVPGAMLVGWVAGLAQSRLDWPYGARRATGLKFRRILQPALEYDLTINIDQSSRRLGFAYAWQSRKIVFGTLLPTPAEAS